MATPIKDTPILYGRDSDCFLKDVRKNEHKRISRDEYGRGVRLYKRVMARATF